jgi:hypothetical protein
MGVIALGLMVAATVSPASAKSRSTAAQDWRNARAQAIPNSDMTVDGSRVAAIHECNSKVDKLKDYTWGDEQFQSYRACMAQHGQVE